MRYFLDILLPRLNGDMIKDDGKEELEQIKEEIKGDEGVDFFMHT